MIQFPDLQIQILLQRYGINRERNLNSNNLEKEERDTKTNDQVQEKNDINHSNNIDKFLKESSIRDRLRRLPSVQDTRIPNEPRLPRLRERNNTITSTNLRNNIDDIFLQELSTGDRPRILPSIQEMHYNSNNTNQERRPYIQETNYNISTRRINLYSNNADQIPIQSTGFRQTLKEIVMVPYIENNRTVSKGSQMYAYF